VNLEAAPVAALVAALRRGEVVIVATDTVYGLAVDPTVPDATQRLFDLKGRDRSIPIAVLVASAEQAWSISTPSPAAKDLAARFWPGALTLVVSRSPSWDADLGSVTSTVGLRWPAAQKVCVLCSSVGPLATTSANLHGGSTPNTLAGVRALFPSVVDALDGGQLGGLPSTVVDCTVTPPRVVREGVIQL
jgi:tRNA threonylcarbamoyl adenosine modification protein (Sua5/YciO/YrdC/YwlC family)